MKGHFQQALSAVDDTLFGHLFGTDGQGVFYTDYPEDFYDYIYKLDDSLRQEFQRRDD